MDALRIQGGIPLAGEVTISGAKNSALPVLCSCLLNGTDNKINNVPQLRDIKTIRLLLESLGCSWQQEGHQVVLGSASILTMEAPYDLVRTMRASVLVLGPLVARFGFARLSLPGGCAIGARPINLHLEGFRKMGADISLKNGYVEVKSRRLKGAKIHLDLPTVTGTENLMMAAVLADGETIINNAAMEPEIVDLAAALVKMGARIQGQGTETIVIQGVNSLHGIEHTVIPDRIETGTFLLAGIITRGHIVLEKTNPMHVTSLLAKLRSAGAVIEVRDSTISASLKERTQSVDVKTMPYPGFPTDMQAQFMALMTVSDGLSVISETIFENRFMHVCELSRMGANIRIEGSHAFISGIPALTGAPVMATDLRASACLVLAGLCAEGETRLSRVYHIDRGYEAIERKLQTVGARIERFEE